MRGWLIFSAALLAVPGIAQARETGDLRGTITDTDGIEVPGATVTLSGANLAGTRTVNTDDSGAYRFGDLGPGEYQLDIQWKSKVVLTAQVQVVLDRVTNASFSINLAENAQVIEVVGVRPVVDTTSSAIGTTMTQSYLQELPVGRSYQDVIQTLPGVSGKVDTERGGAGGGNPSVRGEGQYGNNYMVDGVMTRDPATNTFGANVNFDGIEEITVYTDGAPAEYGQFTGMVANVVTKDGGDEHHGSAAVFYGQHAFFNDTYKIFNPDAGVDEDTIKARFRAPVLNLTAGGPIIKEKLWYFAAIDGNYNWLVPEGLDKDRALSNYGGQGWGKLTWFPNPSWVVRYQLSADFSILPTENAGLLVTEEATEDRKDGGMIHNLRANWTPNADTNLELRLGFLQTYINVVPSSGDRLTPSAYDAQGVVRGNASQFDYNIRNRIGGGFSFSRLLHDAIGEHKFKAGAEYWYLRSVRDIQNTGVVNVDGAQDVEWIDADGNPTGTYPEMGTQYQANPDAGFNCVAPDNSDCGVRQYNLNAGPLGTNVHTLFVYAQDEWQPIKQITLNLGVRFDIEQGMNDAGDPPATQKISEFVEGLTDDEKFNGFLKPRMMPAPRMGISIDPWADGKTRIFGNYGWYYDLAGSDFWEWANTRSSAGFIRQAKDANGDYQWTNTQDPAGSPLIYADDLKPPRLEKMVIGVEREVIKDLSVSVRGMMSQTKNLSEDIDTDLDYWFIANSDIKWRKYRGLELAVNKNFADRWQLLASYTLSESTGTNPGQFELAANADMGSNGNNVGVYLDDVGERDARQFFYDNGLGWILEGFKGLGRYSVSEPEFQDMAGYDGYLPYHSFHAVKINASYRFPFGSLLGVVYEFDSGHAWQKRTVIPFYGFDGMAEGRGSRFMPAAHYIDMRLAHQLNITEDQSVELTLDIFNVPGFAQAITYFDNDAPGFGSTLNRQSPRSARLGAKYRW